MLADRYTARGIPTMPEQIMVTTGAMGAIDAICHLFAGRGERIAVESPSLRQHPPADAGGGRPAGAGRDGRGARRLGHGPRWRQVLRDAAPRLAYVVADFHNPTGALADEDQRRRLVDAARSAGTVLVVDETMTELQLDDGRRACRGPVCAFDPAGSTVLTVGSASKAFWAGMRIGWVRAAPDVIRSLVAARAYADLGTPVLEQLAVNWLMQHRRLGGGRRHPARPGAGEPGRAGRGGAPGAARLGVRRAAAAGSRSGCAPAVSPAPGSPRRANGWACGCPRGPASGSTGPSRGMCGCRSRSAARSRTRRRRGWPRRRGWSRRARAAGAEAPRTFVA